MLNRSGICIVLWTTGCGLKGLLPTKPVVSGADLEQFEAPAASPAHYDGEPKTDIPVLPLQAFGLQYAADVVFVSQHPDWDMHEYARLDTPQRSIWIAKDSNHKGEQTIVADVPKLSNWLPEIPAPRIQAPVVVDDNSAGDTINIRMSYDNPLGQHTEMSAEGIMPSRPPSKRNGNTMGHSRDVVAAVLDIERFGSRIKGKMSIDGEPQRFEKILGLVPFKFLLQQTQAGIVITNFRLSPAETGFSLTRPSPADPDWPTSSQEQWSWDGETARYDNGVVLFEYVFKHRGLSGITVRQHGLDAPTFALKLQPALPDLTRPFLGEHVVDFVMDVNGQQGHGAGRIKAAWADPHTIVLHFEPSSPSWLASRPMMTTIRFTADGSVDVRTTRTVTAP